MATETARPMLSAFGEVAEKMNNVKVVLKSIFSNIFGNRSLNCNKSAITKMLHINFIEKLDGQMDLI